MDLNLFFLPPPPSPNWIICVFLYIYIFWIMFDPICKSYYIGTPPPRSNYVGPLNWIILAPPNQIILVFPSQFILAPSPLPKPIKFTKVCWMMLITDGVPIFGQMAIFINPLPPWLNIFCPLPNTLNLNQIYCLLPLKYSSTSIE